MSDNRLLDKLQHLVDRFEEVSTLITDPSVIADMNRFVKLNKEYSDLEKILEVRNRYKAALDGIAEARQILDSESDGDLRQLANEELSALTEMLPVLEEQIKLLLIPADPEDAKNVIMEIRGGTGGDEAAIFAGDLYKMYSRYCESKGWKTEVTSLTEGTAGGFKEIIFTVTGSDVYGTLKFEAGVHRVQRVPQTETQGRVHTSAATVMVLPEAEEFDVELDMGDVKIIRTTSTGPGGQSVNTTYSAIQLQHIPTGIEVRCQDEKSQHKNLEKAIKVLRSRLYERELAKKQEADSARRKSMVSSGDRSAKIRTYNYPQGRVTDHRIGLTLYDLSNIVNGDLDKIIEELKLAENTEKLKEANETI